MSINLLDVWLVRPLVDDLAFLGVVFVLLLMLCGLFSVPPQRRRRWVVYSLFSLCMCQGLAATTELPTFPRVLAAALCVLVLAVLGRLVGRLSIPLLLVSGLVLAAANAWLPESLWPLLTHFRVLATSKLPVDTGNYPVLPLAVVQTRDGKAVVTVTQWPNPTSKSESLAASRAIRQGKVPPGHLTYQYLQLVEDHGQIVEKLATPQALAQMPFSDLMGAFAPFDRSAWAVVDGRVLQYTVRTETSDEAVARALSPAQYSSALADLAAVADQAQWQDWQQALRRVGERPTPGWYVQNGDLVGTYHGRAIRVHVDGELVVGTGSFTREHAHQVLVAGSNQLQVVSVDEGHGRVVASVRGPVANPIGGAIEIGPVGTSHRDAVFVNASPAYILYFTPDGRAKRLYTAPNENLQFLGSLRFPGEQYPEILANDRSWLRSSNTTYLTSYTYRDGQLYRNWRIFISGMANVRSVRFTAGGPDCLVAALAGQSRYVVLVRHDLPVQPLLVGVWVLVLAGCWVYRWRQRGRSA
ncbi:hypothetical protein [Alicyclobacillus herbarius]|uniref:hypothetical protein n=1 Tax=Alicyclobacillus herbarius TaxID=122960 RepID=UPI00047B575A|nr:hypothetical protein [Alicyclobacillus herbarius]